MIFRYKGNWLKIDKKKWGELLFREKLKYVKEYFSDETKYLIEGIHDFWSGYVDVDIQNMLCGGDEAGEPCHKEIYYISISCGRFHDGNWFSHIDKHTVQQLINDWEFSDKKKFHLHLDLGGGAYQQYTFSKRQKDILIKKLKPLLQMKWYESENKE